MGWGSLNPFRAAQTIVKEVAKAPGEIVETARDITGGIAEAVEDVGKSAKDFLSSDAGMIAVAFLAPYAGPLIAEQMALATALEGSALASAVGTQVAANAVGTALASVALQTAQGVPLETAVQNAGVNAVASTGSPYAANYVNEVVNSPGVANALTSAGISAGATLAKGGSGEDAIKNSLAGAGASAISPTVGRTAAQAIATYAATGDAARAAAAAAAAESGGAARPKTTTETPTTTETTEAPTAPVAEEITVTAPREAPPPVISEVPEVTVTAKKEAPPSVISDIPEVTVTGKRLPKDTSVISDVPEMEITGQREPIPQKADTTQPTTKEASKVGQDLFIFSGQYPKDGALQQALGTTFQAPFYPAASTSGLTSYREGGEIEGTETGGKRRNVWNEESLRLKDALGL